MRKIKQAIFISIIFLLASCGKPTIGPHAIQPEVDICEICNMGIAHEHFATEVILANGDYYVYDDIGCMYEYLQNTQEEVAATYVKDVEKDEWVSAEEAFYVHQPEEWTPMAYGIFSFETREAAEQFIEKSGGIFLTYDQLQKHQWTVKNHE